MPGGEVYYFEGFTLEASEQRLTKDGRPVALAPKAYGMLLALVRSAGELVGKRRLLDLVWADAFVEEGILAVHVSALRKALGDDGRRFIETVPRAGYRFTAAVRRRVALAVLPGREEGLDLAFADALIGALGRFPEAVLRPIRAVPAGSGGAGDSAAAGRALAVDAVIVCQLLGTADRVRVSIQLIRVEDGARLWAGAFDESPAGVMAIADEAALRVASRLGIANGQPEATRPPARAAAHPEVYALFGRGRFHLLASSIFDAPKAVEAFRAAIELDPAYAGAHAGLALAHCAQASLRLAAPATAYAQARDAALRALALDDSCADAQAALGAVMFFGEWNWTGAERSLKRALQLNPNHTEAYLLYGQLLEALGRLEEGLAMKLRALERDPFSPLVNLQISLAHWHRREYDEAIEWAGKALAIDPRHPHAREHLAAAHLFRGDFAGYLAESLKHAELHGAPPEAMEQVKAACTPNGRAGVVRMVLDRAAAQPDAFPALQLALFSAEAGDLDAALRHLDRAIDSRDPCLVHMAVAPQWDRLRADPRFEARLSRMGLKPSQARPAAASPPAP